MDTGSINADRVKVAVYNRIKFELPIIIWEAIDTAFSNYWNDVIGFGNYVNFEETVNYCTLTGRGPVTLDLPPCLLYTSDAADE